VARKGKIKLMFAPGSMMGINIFDSRIIYVPYLPGVEDKNCPEFTVMAQTALGASLERSITAMEQSGFEVLNRCHMMAIAFRLWRACLDNEARLDELSDVPAWLLDKYSKSADHDPPAGADHQETSLPVQNKPSDCSPPATPATDAGTTA
jgi:hypothetical protein